MNETIKNVFTPVLLGVGFFCAGFIVGYGFRYVRQDRTVNSTVTELERQFEETKQQYISTIDRLESLNTRTKQIVDSMGEQLDTDTGTLADAAGNIRRLRVQIQALKDLYSDSSSSDIGNNSMVSGEVE